MRALIDGAELPFSREKMLKNVPEIKRSVKATRHWHSMGVARFGSWAPVIGGWA